MPLADFQAALGTIVAVGATANRLPIAQLNLTRAEAGWLDSLHDASGFKVTCAIQRWWRETRLRDLARLTIAALGTEAAAPMINDYLQNNLCTSLFFLPETLRFLQFVESQTNHPHLASIAQFEHALLLAKEEAAQPTPAAERAMTIVTFAAPPEEILAAVLQGQPLPESRAEAFPVLISSLLPHFWRPALPQEYLT